MTEQIFTDEDLKRLKAWSTSNGLNSLSIEKAQALLARLEASENYHIERDRHAQQICGLCVSLRETWRQVSGKK